METKFPIKRFLLSLVPTIVLVLAFFGVDVESEIIEKAVLLLAMVIGPIASKLLVDADPPKKLKV